MPYITAYWAALAAKKGFDLNFQKYFLVPALHLICVAPSNSDFLVNLQFPSNSNDASALHN